LECLVALLAISLSLVVMLGMTRLVMQDFTMIERSKEKNWQNFSNLLRREFETATLDRLSDQFLYVKTPHGVRRFGLKPDSDDFRKTDENGLGYQPMLYGLSAVQMSRTQNVVTIHLTFKEGGKKVFIYAFPKDK
jgi:competence protein ComGF